MASGKTDDSWERSGVLLHVRNMGHFFCPKSYLQNGGFSGKEIYKNQKMMYNNLIL
jgi:hypothetical protein